MSLKLNERKFSHRLGFNSETEICYADIVNAITLKTERAIWILEMLSDKLTDNDFDQSPIIYLLADEMRDINEILFSFSEKEVQA